MNSITLLKHLLDAHQSFNRPNLQVAQQTFEKKKNKENKPTDSCWHAKLQRFWRYINVISKINHTWTIFAQKKRYQAKKNILKEIFWEQTRIGWLHYEHWTLNGYKRIIREKLQTKATSYAEWLKYTELNFTNR